MKPKKVPLLPHFEKGARLNLRYRSLRRKGRIAHLRDDQEGMRSLTENLGKTLETHFIGLRRYATSLSGDYGEAEDLVQECLVRALAHEHVWDQVHNQRAYLFTILHNVYVDRRSKNRRNMRNVPIDDVAGELFTQPQQHERLEIRDFQRAIEQLPSNYKAVTLLVGLEGMSYQQAARSLGIPVGTVMSRLSRGRKMLRRHMNGENTRNLLDGEDALEN